MESADNALRMLDPQAHMSAFIEQGVRYDGRSLAEHRQVEVKELSEAYVGAGTCVGAVSVTMRGASGAGGTCCLCHVSVQVGKPALHAPYQGDIQFDVNCSQQPDDTQQRKKSDECVDLEALLYDVYTPPGAALPVVPLQQLCLVPGQQAMRLCVALFFQSVDGNLQDCAVHAVWHALKHTRLPRSTSAWAGAESRVVLTLAKSAPLQLLGQLSACTYAVWPTATAPLFLADPSRAEEQLVQDTVTVVRMAPLAAEGSGQEGEAVRGMFFNAVGNCGALTSRRGESRRLRAGTGTAKGVSRLLLLQLLGLDPM